MSAYDAGEAEPLASTIEVLSGYRSKETNEALRRASGDNERG